MTPAMTPKITPRRLFCFGLGYSVRALARRLAPQGWRIAGTCRTPEKIALLRAEGIEAHLFSSDHPLDDPAAALAGATHILTSIPPAPDGSDPVLAAHGADINALAPGIAWLGYLSTTGVYGDRGGGWVDETSALAPTGDRGRRRMAAEKVWASFGATSGVPVQIFRLAGIYGPGRNQLVSLRQGTARPIDKPGQVFSRIHVDDIAAVLAASMAMPQAGAVYNVCDDEAAPTQTVIAYAAGLLGIAPPALVPFEAAQRDPGFSPMALSFYADNKRVANTRIKQELGVTLRYPTYREGLDALYKKDVL